jgi:hypothetical protein
MNKSDKFNLKFDASKLSINILKRYLKRILSDINPDDFVDYKIPDQYLDNPDYNTSYKAIQEMSVMSLKEWKLDLEKANNDISKICLDDIEKDSKYYYESFRLIQHQVGNHDSQFEFYKFFYEIIHELISRNFIDVDYTNYISLEEEEEKLEKHEIQMQDVTQETQDTTGGDVSFGNQNLYIGNKVSPKTEETEEDVFGFGSTNIFD